MFTKSSVCDFCPCSAGSLVEQVDLPVSAVTSCCFGGVNLDELYVTSVGKMHASDEATGNPLDGSLFRVRGLHTKGVAVPMFGSES